MKTKIIIILLLIGSHSLLAQQKNSTIVDDIASLESDLLIQQNNIITLQALNDSLYVLFEKHVNDFEEKNQSQKNKIFSQKISIERLREKIATQKEDIASLELSRKTNNQKIKTNDQNITTNSKQLGTEIQKVTTDRNTQISALDDTIGKNQLYWIIATLGTLVFGGLMYVFLGKRIKSSKTDVETQIRNTKQSLEEESVKLDSKLVEILETKLKVSQEETDGQSISSNNRVDHSLALKIADEVLRMQKNIAKMDSSTKGIKPLLKGIERIQNNFVANGYEMINHLNTKYNELDNIDVINFITDENLSEGTRIITAVIKPQVNFNGIKIQSAQVDVSQN